MQFVIRVDDIGWSNKNGDKRDHGLDLAKRFHNAMKGFPYLAAIIPTWVDTDGFDWLHSRPTGMTFALHGWEHKQSNDGVASEFRGMDVNKCRYRLALGKIKLADSAIDHLVLPFNRFENELLEACYLERIHWIWGGGNHCTTTPSLWPTPPQPYPVGRVGFVPSWAFLYGATQWRMGSEDLPIMDMLPKLIGQPGKSVLTLHITWEAAKCEDFDGVRWLVDEIGDRVISPDEYLA